GWQWVRATAWPQLSVEQRALARTHRRLIHGLSGLIRALDRRIAQVAAPIPEARLLATDPGIAPHRALFTGAEALPITRCPRAGHRAISAGQVRGSSQSGQRGVRHGPLRAG